MITRSQSIQNFNDKMSDLINSKFIVAEKKIAEVLISISDSVLFYELFQHASEGFDYPTVKKVCFSHDSQGNGIFKLPKNDADVLALGLAILSEIDNGETDIIDLCTEYFPSPEGKQRSYSIFATQLLIPFQQTALRVAKDVLNVDNGQEMLPKEEVVDDVGEEEEKKQTTGDCSGDEKSSELPDSPYLTQLINECVEIISTGKKGIEPYVDFMYVLQQYQNAIKEMDTDRITLANMAIIYMKDKVKKIKVDLQKITFAMKEILL